MELIENEKNIICNNLEDVLHQSMLPYAEHVIMDRVIPRVEDGLKPVQRRIIYTMYEDGIFPDKGYRKSAGVVGDCLGKYHPHGDTSVYDAMVRLAQPYNMRMTLVDGQGNFGSIDGDPPAAMRYTEVKMQPLALELIKDIEKDTVKWSPNFDDRMKEPNTLPSSYPNLLVNGATGIAVGIATNIPTHNLGEVIDGACAYIKNPKITIDEMMKIIPGPDFPTGGYVIAGDELKKAYIDGRGKILIRAKVYIEEGDNDNKSIIITEIPYGVNKANLLQDIDNLREERGGEFEYIKSVNDESDRKGMRAVIKLKSGAPTKKILDGLYKYTQLQVSFGINMMVIADGKPKQLGIIDILRYYTDYRRNVILNRTKYDLEKARERAHILEGLIIAVTNIDEVVKIIKNAKDTADARQGLRKRFNLSERQANAILDLRLARLTRLEVDNLKEELRQLKEFIKECEEIIASKRKQNEIVIGEMQQVKKKYHDDRRSTIVYNEDKIDVVKSDDKAEKQTFAIGITAKNKIRKIKPSQYKKIVEDLTPNLKEIFNSIVYADSDEIVYCFTNLGNVYKIDVDILAEAKGSFADGIKLEDLFKESKKGEKPIKLFTVNEKSFPQGDLLFITKLGEIKLSSWEYMNVSSSSFSVVKLKDKDEVINVEVEEKDKTILFITAGGMTLNCLKDDIPNYRREAGTVTGMVLDGKDTVIFASQVSDSDVVAVGASNGKFKKVKVDEIKKLPKRRKGIRIIDLTDKNKAIVEVLLGAIIVEKDKGGVCIKDRLLTDKEYYFEMKDIVLDDRDSKGKPLSVQGFGQTHPESIYFFKPLLK